MQDVITKCLGLVNQYSPLSTAPGALALANNAINIRENILEDRRGYKVDTTAAASIKNVLSYSNKILVHQGTTINYGISGSYAAYSGSYTEPTSNRIRAAEASGNLYFTTSLGVKVFTDVAGTAARASGVPRCLDISYALNAAGTGFLANNFQVAYRATLSKTDANSNVLTGYPSSRLWAVNAAGTSKNLDLTVYIPSETIAGDVIKFYRTAQVTGTTSDDAGDECALVYSYTITSTDISNGFVTFTDSITDALRGETLYTSPSQQGILQANDRAPLCKDIALFRSSFMMFANTSTKQRLFLTMVGTSALTGQTITLGGTTYNFGATEIISGGGSPQVRVSATGVAAFDIDATARSFVRVINRYTSNTTVYAYYLTGPDDLPGQLMIEEKGIGAAAFTALSSNTAIGGMFFPAPPVGTPNTKSTSSNTIQKNALYYSKYQELEHVPTLNYLLVGPSNKEILRIAPLRESLIIIKEEGVYRLTGENPQSFTVTPLDLTVYCKAINSVAVLSNQVLFLSNQGVVSASETGIQVISHEIEPSIRLILSKSNLTDFTFGIGYESDRHYLLSTLSDPSDSAANQTLVYNIFTRTWCRWTYPINAAAVDPSTDKIYFSKASDAKLYVERKDFAVTDYADPEQSITVTALDSANSKVTFTSSNVPEIGNVIEIAGTGLAIVSFLTVAGTYIATMESTLPTAWVTGAASMFPGVGLDMEWNAWLGGNAAGLKQVRAIKVLTDNTPGANSVSALFATFTSNFDENMDEVSLTNDVASWGAGPWGAFAWGGGADSFGYPTWVPRNKQYCTRLSVGVKHKKAREKISIAGIGLDFEQIGDRIGR